MAVERISAMGEMCLERGEVLWQGETMNEAAATFLVFTAPLFSIIPRSKLNKIILIH